MAFETSPFGGASNVTSNVSNHYGERFTGGGNGKTSTSGITNESIVNFSITGPLHDKQSVPAGALVIDVKGYGLTGSISSAAVGVTSIVDARIDDDSTWVPIVTAGDLKVSGPTAGSVAVTWKYTAV